MSNNLGRTEVSVSQTQKELAINNSDSVIDAAITSSLNVAWTGAESLKVLTQAQLRQNLTFVMTGGTTAPSPVLKMAAVQRGMVLVKNDLSQILTITDNTSAQEVYVNPGLLVAVYVTSTGVLRVFESDSVILPADVSYTVDVATTAEITIATALNAGDSIDGQVLVAGQKVLVKNQTTDPTLNGIYVVGASPARATDFDDGGTEVVAGSLISISSGTANGGTMWVLMTNNPITVGTSNLIFKKLSQNPTAFATDTEVMAGTASGKAVSPATLAPLWVKGSDVASATTLTLGNGRYFHVTGTTTISDIDWTNATDGREAILTFDGVLTLTHSATTLKLPSGANIVTAAGDRAAFIQDAADNVVCLWYQRADGTALVTSSGLTSATTSEALTGTDTAKFVTPDAMAALWEKGSDVASATTLNLGEGGYFHVTGTTTISDIDWNVSRNGRFATLVFDAPLTITHNATTLVLPSGADISTAAGDTAVFVQDNADNVKCIMYQRADGTSLVTSSFAAATTTEALTGTETAKAVTPDSLAALWEKGSDVASAATTSLGEGGFFHVTGTTTITDIDFAVDKAGRSAWVMFTGALTLTHSATLILPTGANIATAAGDVALFVSEGTDVIRCAAYLRANGTALSASTPTVNREITVACSDETTDITAGTGKVTFRAPRAMTLTGIRASLSTAGSTTTTVDVNLNGATIMTTNKLNFDSTERTTVTYSGTAATLTTTAIADDDEFTVDIDTAGTGAKGLKVTILYT